MPLTFTLFDILFLSSVTIIWLMIIYQLILTLFGYRYRQQLERSFWNIENFPEKYPSVSILIPARNEEVVIRNTLKKVRSLDYPGDKLEILVINDGSTDRTGEIIESIAQEDKRVRHIQLPAAEVGRGKSHALNFGLKQSTHDLIAVYDADNNPEPNSLKLLIINLISEPSLGAVIGKFRTLNRKRNILTRFINIETLSFQWILQAGRFRAFRVAILPGTNCVIRKSVLEKCGGWDEDAITEDAELSVRIYQNGWKIKFVPTAVTWEQEPEKWSTWIRQRTRWVRGNNYVIKKYFRQAFRLGNRYLFLEFIYSFILYYLFLIAIVLSHFFFILCGLDIISVNVPGPYTAVWISAFILYLLEVSLVLSYEREDNIFNFFLTVLMYFTYCQMWIYVVFRGFFLDLFQKNVGVWDKTERVPQAPLS